MRRIRQYVFTVVMLLLAGGMLACGGPWRDGYFKKVWIDSLKTK